MISIPIYHLILKYRMGVFQQEISRDSWNLSVPERPPMHIYIVLYPCMYRNHKMDSEDLKECMKLGGKSNTVGRGGFGREAM